MASQEKGPLWQIYGHHIEGRLLRKPDGTLGVVVSFKFHDYTQRYASEYLVRWDNSTWPVEESSEDVLSWLTDVFANETWVPRKIRAAQLANWHVPPPELFEDPRLKVAPRRKPAPPSDDENNENEDSDGDSDEESEEEESEVEGSEEEESEVEEEEGEEEEAELMEVDEDPREPKQKVSEPFKDTYTQQVKVLGPLSSKRPLDSTAWDASAAAQQDTDKEQKSSKQQKKVKEGASAAGGAKSEAQAAGQKPGKASKVARSEEGHSSPHAALATKKTTVEGQAGVTKKAKGAAAEVDRAVAAPVESPCASARNKRQVHQSNLAAAAAAAAAAGTSAGGGPRERGVSPFRLLASSAAGVVSNVVSGTRSLLAAATAAMVSPRQQQQGQPVLKHKQGASSKAGVQQAAGGSSKDKGAEGPQGGSGSLTGSGKDKGAAGEGSVSTGGIPHITVYAEPDPATQRQLLQQAKSHSTKQHKKEGSGAGSDKDDKDKEVVHAKSSKKQKKAAAAAGATPGGGGAAVVASGAEALYKGAAALLAEGYTHVQSWTGRVYPLSECYKEGDRLGATATAEELEGEFEVEAVIDEAVYKKRVYVLIKWAGWESRVGDGRIHGGDKGDWEELGSVRDNIVVQEWIRGPKPDWFLEQLTEEQAAALFSPKVRGSAQKAKKTKASYVVIDA